MADLRLESPVGTAVYPALQRPDTKFDELGIYKADLAVPMADAEPLMAQLQDIAKKHTGKALKKTENALWYFETDDEGEETGNVIFKFRVKNKINRKGDLWDRRPKLFDAALKPVDVNPWGGTKMVVSFDVREWEFGGKKGVSLQPVGVQILELKSGSGDASAESMGFKARDGYTAPDEAADAGLTGGVDASDDSADDDGADY